MKSAVSRLMRDMKRATLPGKGIKRGQKALDDQGSIVRAGREQALEENNL